MNDVLYIVSNVVSIAIFLIQLAMTVRAVLSWIPMDPNKFTDFLFSITEPFIYPFRALFFRLNWFQEMPIDMAFVFAYGTLLILSLFL